jgi:hypothetical protein
LDRKMSGEALTTGAGMRASERPETTDYEEGERSSSCWRSSRST